MKSIFDNLKSGNFASIKDTHVPFQGDTQQAPNYVPNGVNNMDSALDNMSGLGDLLGAGVFGGLLGTLMSGRSAQRICKSTLTIGGSATIGAIAWNFYKKWAQPCQEQDAQSTANTISPPTQADLQQSGTDQEQAPPFDNDTSMVLLEVMIFAARAYGHIDEQEKKNVYNVVSQLYPKQDINQLLDGLINKPLNPNSLAARIKSPEEALDVYRLSCMILEIDHFMERSYLDGLAVALNIPSATKQELELEVTEIKKQLAKS